MRVPRGTKRNNSLIQISPKNSWSKSRTCNRRSLRPPLNNGSRRCHKNIWSRVNTVHFNRVRWAWLRRLNLQGRIWSHPRRWAGTRIWRVKITISQIMLNQITCLKDPRIPRCDLSRMIGNPNWWRINCSKSILVRLSDHKTYQTKPARTIRSSCSNM